jgi:hypothetical protein
VLPAAAAVQAHMAQEMYSTFTQEQVDVIFKAAASAASAARIDLAVQVGVAVQSKLAHKGSMACMGCQVCSSMYQQHAATKAFFTGMQS